MHFRTRCLLPISLVLLSHLSACSSDSPQSRERGGSGGASLTTTGSIGSGPGTGGGIIGTGGSSGGNPSIEEPTTCEQAAANRTYVGCDFWPTIVANPVYVDFDPAVVVANG